MKLILQLTMCCIFICVTTVSSANNYYQNPISTYTGVVVDNFGSPLPGVTVLIKGTQQGDVTGVDGGFSVTANPGDVLLLSFTGFKTIELILTTETNLNTIQVEDDIQILNVVDVVGIRKSLQEEVENKRDDDIVSESITPQDIGNFSDENVIDALERVPGVQVERDYTGNSGSRAAIRGLGAQFVQTNINGRTSVSTGDGGLDNFREFNQGNIPTEMIKGATISKTAQAKAIEGGVGGSIDYKLVKPLTAKYLSGTNFFGSVTARATTQPAVKDLDPTHRASVIFGGRNKAQTLGAHVTFLSSSDITFQEGIGAINGGIREFDLNVDSNDNGVFDPEFGDQTIEGVTAIERYNLQTRANTQNRLGASGAVQWRPNKKFEIIVDGNVFNRTRDESTQRIQLNNAGVFTTELWQPGSYDLSPTNFLTYADRSRTSSNQAPVFFQLRQNNLSTEGTEIIGGTHIIYKHKKWIFDADVSVSTSEFLNFNRNGTNVNFNTTTPTLFDSRNTDALYFSIGDEGFRDPSNYVLNNPDDLGRLNIRTAQNSNIGAKLDVNRKLNKRYTLDFGYRYSASTIRSREINRDVAVYFTDPDDPENTAALDEVRTQFEQIVANATLANPFFENYRIGDNQFPSLNVQDIFALYGGAYEGDISNYKVDNLFDVPTERENGFGLNPNNALDFDETSNAFYAQLNLKRSRQSKFSGNIGVRVVGYSIFSRSFSNLQFTDPLGQITTIATNSFQESTNERTRWDVLPSMNLTFKPKNNIQIRLAGSRTISRPRVTQLVPRNQLTVIDPSSAIADPDSPFFDPNDPSTTLRIGNPDLKPYFTWNSDFSFEYYTKRGGAFVFGAYHKFFQGFIANRILPDAEFPDESVIGFSIPESSQQFPVVIRQFQNFTDAQLYGFEVGFNQPLTFLPAPFKGLGVRANYNFTQGIFDEETGITENGFPGSSVHSYNGIIYYDRKGLGVRLAYAWRSDFYRTIPDPFGANIGIQTARFQQGAGSLSARASYNFSKRLQVSLSGNNITGANRRRYLGDSRENLTDFFQLVSTWLVGVRYRF